MHRNKVVCYLCRCRIELDAHTCCVYCKLVEEIFHFQIIFCVAFKYYQLKCRHIILDTHSSKLHFIALLYGNKVVEPIICHCQFKLTFKQLLLMRVKITISK